MVVVPGGVKGGDQCLISAFLTLFCRAEYFALIRHSGLRVAEASGTKCELIIGILDRQLMKGRVRCATVSTGSWVLMGRHSVGVLQFRGR